jgi:hypothetical protein
VKKEFFTDQFDFGIKFIFKKSSPSSPFGKQEAIL